MNNNKENWSKERLAISLYYNIAILLLVIILDTLLKPTNWLIQIAIILIILAYIVGIYIKIDILRNK